MSRRARLEQLFSRNEKAAPEANGVSVKAKFNIASTLETVVAH
jgi:hypothetical protein